MTAPEAEFDGAPPPRVTQALFGHAATETALLAAYSGGRVPHAFMLIGEKGIGKATLAFRMARFVLANPDPAAPKVRAATSLALDPDHPVARRVAAQAHGDLLVLERNPNEKGTLRQQIPVDDVRRTVPFFGSTAGEGGWRVAIVDAMDDLNRFGANALLKVLEEPPERALLLLVCHSASRALPTLRSRCRVLAMRTLSEGEVTAALAAATAMPASDAHVRRPPPRPTAVSHAQLRSSTGTLWRCASVRSTSSIGCPRSTSTRCMRSAMHSPGPTCSRWPPSSTLSTCGCRGGSRPSRT